MEAKQDTSQLREILKNLGFRDDQVRGEDYYHNAGWYVSSGEKVGYGDLSQDDLLVLSKFATEPVILLHESDSFWRFVKRPGLIGSMADVDRGTEQNPGADYVIDKMAAVIIPAKGGQPGVLYKVSDYKETEETLKSGLKCFYTSRDKVKSKLEEQKAKS